MHLLLFRIRIWLHLHQYGNNTDLMVISIALMWPKWLRQKSKRLKFLIIHVVNVHTHISETFGGSLFCCLIHSFQKKKTEKWQWTRTFILNAPAHPGCILVRNKPALFKITEIWGVVCPAAVLPLFLFLHQSKSIPEDS